MHGTGYLVVSMVTPPALSFPRAAALPAAVLSETDEPPRMEAMAAARAAGKLGSDVRAFTVSANSAGGFC